MTDFAPIITGIVGAVTGATALVLSVSKSVREIRAVRPVEWNIEAKKTQATDGSDRWNAVVWCAGADALGVIVEYRQPPDQVWWESRPALPVGEQLDFVMSPKNPGEAWVTITYSHPMDRRRPWRAWFPLMSSGIAFDEYRRQQVTSPIVSWFRRNIALSHVGPGGIIGRHTGWRDRHIVRKALRDRGVKRWDGALEANN
jgi:hypothetical protein